MCSEAFEEFNLKISELEANDKVNCVWQTNTKGFGNDVSCRLEGYMESATAVDAIYTNPKGSQGCLLVVTAAADSSLLVWNGLEGDGRHHQPMSLLKQDTNHLATTVIY
jgi:hypothetical protein